MGILSDIEKVRSSAFVLGLLGIALIISPGLLILYAFQHDLFLSLDLFKLLFLSISYLTPLFTINTFGFLVLFDKLNEEETRRKKGVERKTNEELWFPSFFVALMVSGMLLYLDMMLVYFLQLDEQWIVYIASVLELLILVLIVLLSKSADKGT